MEREDHVKLRLLPEESAQRVEIGNVCLLNDHESETILNPTVLTTRKHDVRHRVRCT